MTSTVCFKLVGHRTITIFKGIKFSFSDKIKTFLQEFYHDGDDGSSKVFKYAEQMVCSLISLYIC